MFVLSDSEYDDLLVYIEDGGSYMLESMVR